TYVEQMPQLPSGGGDAAIWQVIMQNLRLPRGSDGGSAVVEFVVTPTGVISKVQLRRATSAALGAAVVAATQQLPRLVPGRQAGQRVPVRMVIPFSCIKTQ
ncbi:MAG: energy transducer TonB, partial [Bacteroidota bacterium]|nr:energy transducer TonB [Bacteroidota bacterium]